MKAILISTLPKACKAIASGEQTLLLTKRLPKLETPFKVYVYCTKQKLTKKECMHSYLHKNEPKACKKYGEITTWCSIGDVHVNSNTPWSFRSYGMHGKVIGSFVCDKIDEYEANERGWYIYPQDETCLWTDEIAGYGKGETLYGWHISELKIYDKPKKLSEFRKPCLYGDLPCWECPSCDRDEKDNLIQCFNTLSRPPQSWCYVEELEESDHV